MFNRRTTELKDTLIERKIFWKISETGMYGDSNLNMMNSTTPGGQCTGKEQDRIEQDRIG